MVFSSRNYIIHPEYDGLIYITDDEADDPEIPDPYHRLPVSWIITEDDLTPKILRGWTRREM